MNSWIFGKRNKKDKSLDELTKRMTQFNRIRDERGERTTDTNKIHGISFRKEIGKFHQKEKSIRADKHFQQRDRMRTKNL